MNQFLTDWLYFLEGPKDPPFKLDANFDDQSGRFVRMLITACALTAAVLGLSAIKVGDIGSDVVGILFSTPFALKAVTFIALFAVLYWLFARILGIRLGLKQSFYAFGFVVVPWLPIVAAVIVLGRHFPLFWFLYFIAIFSVPAYVLALLGTAIRTITGARRFRVIASLAIPVLIALFGVGALRV